MRRIRAFELLTFKNVILQIYINQQNVLARMVNLYI